MEEMGSIELAGSVKAATSNDYPFDQPEILVRFNARPGADKPAMVTHRLRKPTLAQLIEWEKASPTETVEVNRREDEVRTDDGAANLRLWKHLIVGIQGYDLGDGQPVNGFRDLADEQKDRIKDTHKLAAIRGLYDVKTEIDYSGLEDTAPSAFGGETWRVVQRIGGGAYVVTYTMREPNEAERVKFRRNSSSTSYLRGARRVQAKTRTNLNAYVELFDTVIQGVEGGTAQDRTFSDSDRAAFLAHVDPILKHRAIAILMDAIDAELQD